MKTDPLIVTQSKLFSQKKFKDALKNSEYPTFDVEDIFDKKFKPGKDVGVGKPEKKKKKQTFTPMKKCPVILESRRYQKY